MKGPSSSSSPGRIDLHRPGRKHLRRRGLPLCAPPSPPPRGKGILRWARLPAPVGGQAKELLSDLGRRPLDFDTFSQRAHEIFQEIPLEFREGLDGLTVRPEALPHPILSDIYTLGHCLTERYPSDWGGPDTIRSIVVLYHGSFRALASMDPGFDWETELWETLTHEVRHHLESLAREDELAGVDYAMDEAFKRDQGEVFDPLYYRRGMEVAPGIYQVEYDFFLEQEWDKAVFEKSSWIEFSWHGRRWRIPRPETLGDLHYVWVWGVDVGPGSLQLVLVRRKGWWRRVLEWRRREEPELWESEAEAEPVPGEAGSPSPQ